MLGRIQEILGSDTERLLNHQCKTISKDKLHLPGPDFIDRIHIGSDRPTRSLVSLQQLFKSGRLAGTGYVSILPVDQGIEHSAGASFAPNPIYFDPENIVKLAIEGGCNAVATTLGVLGSVARKYAHKIPFLLKFNHNEQSAHLLHEIIVRLRQGNSGKRAISCSAEIAYCPRICRLKQSPVG